MFVEEWTGDGDVSAEIGGVSCDGDARILFRLCYKVVGTAKASAGKLWLTQWMQGEVIRIMRCKIGIAISSDAVSPVAV